VTSIPAEGADATINIKTLEIKPVPKIKLISPLGLESVAWAFVIGHIVNWAVDCWYYITTQLVWGFNAPKTGDRINYWNLVDIWDHLPYWVGRTFNNIGVHASWVTWLMLKSTDNGWTEPRHLARGVGIGLIAGVFITFLFAKPDDYGDEKEVGPVRFALTPALALIYAIPGVAVIGVLAFYLPWLLNHGLHVPQSGEIKMPTAVPFVLLLLILALIVLKVKWFRKHELVAAGLLGSVTVIGAAVSMIYIWTTVYLGDYFANEVNSWFAAGAWIGALMGIAGSQFFAKKASKKPGDAAQWFYAERSAAKINSTHKSLSGKRVIGTPTHRARVHYLLDNDIAAKDRGTWTVVLLSSFLLFVIISAGGGAYITLAGPAAGH